MSSSRDSIFRAIGIRGGHYLSYLSSAGLGSEGPGGNSDHQLLHGSDTKILSLRRAHTEAPKKSGIAVCELGFCTGCLNYTVVMIYLNLGQRDWRRY